MINDYSTPFKSDKNQNADLLIYVREDIPYKILNEYTSENHFQRVSLKINLRARKELLSCSYNPNTNSIIYHLH